MFSAQTRLNAEELCATLKKFQDAHNSKSQVRVEYIGDVLVRGIRLNVKIHYWAEFCRHSLQVDIDAGSDGMIGEEEIRCAVANKLTNLRHTGKYAPPVPEPLNILECLAKKQARA